jgi:hypothetical protein
MNSRLFCIDQNKFEIFPKLSLVANGRGHQMRQFVHGNKRERMWVNQFVSVFGGIQAKCQFLSFVFAVCSQFAGGQGFRDFGGIEIFYQLLNTHPRAVFLSKKQPIFAIGGCYCQQIGGQFNLFRSRTCDFRLWAILQRKL